MNKAKKDAIEAELESFYDNPIPEAMTGDLRWWIVNIACGAVTDDEIMSLVAIRDSLRAEVTRLEAENERMREAIENLEENVLHKIDDWANAYPEDVFIEPTPDQWRAADKLLKEHGMSMTAITGSAARHCVAGIKSYAKRGMKIISELESEAPNDSTKPKKTMTQEGLDLLHANLE